MRALVSLTLLSLLAACERTGGEDDRDRDGAVDADGDGFAVYIDCDDTDPEVYPGHSERCDGIDNDCDGVVDEDDAVDAEAWRPDADGDGFGDATAEPVLTCEQPEDHVANALDCDDSEAMVHPEALERCVDGMDNDCDGEIDEADAVDAATWYEDADGDGHGSIASTTAACTRPEGFAALADDCNDADPLAFPDADELCDGVDNDCDDEVDEDDAVDPTSWYADADGDGYGNPRAKERGCEAPTGYVANDGDCDDLSADNNPDGTEVCDGVDNDCDDAADEGLYGFLYRDRDGDGYGDATATYYTCQDAADVPGYVADTSDCDDNDASLNPDTAWYADTDGDGYGDASNTTSQCTQPSGYLADDTDCDDTDASLSPETPWYADDDGDGYGDPDNIALSCTQPTGYTTDTSDCDDTDSSLNPDTVWYADDDGDGYGDALSTTASCAQPSGYLSDDSDCDDTDGTLSPETVWYADADGDGYGDVDSTTTQCTQPSGYLADTSDCDDTDSSLNPDTVWYADADGDGYGDSASTAVSCEQPSGYLSDDQDCDDTDAALSPDTVWYQDADGDGYGGTLRIQTQCLQPASGYVLNVLDCDDIDPAINPDTLWYADLDFDGYGDASNTTASCLQPSGYLDDNTDCNDGDDRYNPDTVWYADLDGDGYGDADSTAVQCAQPSGYLFDEDTDCDDAEALANPGLSEVCGDDIDNDCDGEYVECFLEGDYTVSDAEVAFYAADSSDLLGGFVGGGNSLASGCDLNADGYDELIMGAPYANQYTDSSECCRGTAYVVNGPASGVVDLASEYSARIYSNHGATYTLLGSAVDCADVDGDGLDDVVTSRLRGAGGSVMVFYGPISGDVGYSTADVATSSGDTDTDEGYSLTLAGDYDGDGTLDLGWSNFGSTSPYQAAFLLLGPITSSGHDVTIDDDGAGYAGFDLEAAGDVDGDGFDDLLLSAPSDGLLFLFSGGSGGLAAGSSIGTSDATATIAGAAGDLGTEVCQVGDLTGDGYADVLASSPSETAGDDAVYLLAGPLSGTHDASTSARLTATVASSVDGHNLGRSCDGGQDLDGDGTPELLLGGPEYSEDFSQGGAGWLFYGPLSGTMDEGDADASFGASGEQQFLGARVRLGGDMDGDGRGEILLSAYAFEQPDGDKGAVFLFETPGL